MSTCLQGRDAAGWETCLHALAAGNILPIDLCAHCTQRFMCALGAVEPNLVWHPEFREQAKLPAAESERVR